MQKRTLKSGRVRPINARLDSQHYWEEKGWVVQVSEFWWKSYADAGGPRWRKYDFAGFADLLCWKEGRQGMLAVQACAWSDVGSRIRKISRLPLAYSWLQVPGNRIIVMGWRYAESRRVSHRRKSVWVTLDEHFRWAFEEGACSAWPRQ